MLSRKDYRAIAELVKTQIVQYHTQGRPAYANGVESLATRLAIYFQEDNATTVDSVTGKIIHQGFDRQKFLDACGIS